MPNMDNVYSHEDKLARLLQMEKSYEDKEEFTFRPQTFDDYVGQKQIKENLQVFIQAAKARGEALDHVLLYGPPGLGKTTLAGIIAKEMEANFRTSSGPAIEKPGDLAALLTNLQERDVLFIDEIHRLPKTVEEILYPAMEDGFIDIMLGKGPSAHSIRLDIAPFTLIGATTKAGSISAPLRDRFGIINRLELYKMDEIKQILLRDASLLSFTLDDEALNELAKASRGTPRIAIRLLKRLRDFAEVASVSNVDYALCKKALQSLGIDQQGLDDTDRNLLKKMIEHYRGGPVGLDTLAALTGEDRTTLEDMIEPYLMSIGFLAKTPRGRIVSESAYQHLGYTFPKD